MPRRRFAAAFPQRCVRSDRRSAYLQWDLSLPEALRTETLLGLEVMLNAIQALIFSVLTLIFITLAIESHEHEEGHVADEAMETIHDTEASTLQPAH